MPAKRMLIGKLERELSAARLIRVQKRIMRLWHERERSWHGWEDVRRQLPLPAGRVSALAGDIARINTFQWHEEDKARDTQASDGCIAAIKRSIDQSNQRRVDAIEAFDSLLEQRLGELGVRRDADLPLNSETPGSLVDRISILLLKFYHMSEQRARRDISSGQRRKFAKRVAVLREQLADMALCLDDLIRAVCAGKRRFKTYFQLKMYNDPETNPYIRKFSRTTAS